MEWLFLAPGGMIFSFSLPTEKFATSPAKRFFRKMLKGEPLLSPAKIGTDGANTFPSAIKTSVDNGHLRPDPVHHVTKRL